MTNKQKYIRLIATSIIFVVVIAALYFVSQKLNTADEMAKINEMILEDAGHNDPKVLVQEDEETQFDEDNLIDDLMNYEYFVCPDKEELQSQVETAGFELIYESSEHFVFKNNRECTIYFVRHGQTDANVAQLFAGSGTDATLTRQGEEQALATGKALSEVSFSDVYASELTRTQKTAELVLSENASETPEIEVLSQWNDIDWGQVEGMPASEVFSIYPDFNEDTYIGTATDESFVSPIQAETKVEVISRMHTALNQVVAETEGNALVVGHSSMIWCLKSMFGEQISVDGLDNASITILHYVQGNWSVERVNVSADEY